jgi:hypothetical protein
LNDVDARHAEMARRYARAKRERFGPYDRGRHRCAEVLRLAGHRRSQGRLDFDPDAVVGDIMANPRLWTARAIGSRLALTWEERTELGLTTMEAADITAAEAKRRKRQRRIILNRERQRRYRRRRKAGKPAPQSPNSRNAGVHVSSTYRKALWRLRFLRAKPAAQRRNARP